MWVWRGAEVFWLTTFAWAVASLLCLFWGVVELDIGAAGKAGGTAGPAVDLCGAHAVDKVVGGGVTVDDCAPAGRGGGG